MYTILIIDDDKPILTTLKLVLSRYGYNVETASDGLAGIKKFDAEHFDLVITDIQMPGLDGNRVARHIRSSKRQYIPVIAISGTPWLFEDEDFDAVLSKPFLPKTLASTIEDLLATPKNEGRVDESSYLL